VWLPLCLYAKGQPRQASSSKPQKHRLIYLSSIFRQSLKAGLISHSSFFILMICVLGHAPFQLCKVLLMWMQKDRYVTVSGKTGLIAHLQVLRNAGFKYFRCCSLPMVIATSTKLSHVLQQCITFQILQ